MAYSSRDIDVLDALQAIRRRPAMYIGAADAEHTMCSRLVTCTVDHIATDTPAPTAVHLVVWAGNVFTVGFDGEPLPIRPSMRPATDIPHPELYRVFMELRARSAGASFSLIGGVIVNALSERLLVSTIHDGVRYRAVFRHGGLVSLLSKAGHTEESFGTNWITFKPDESVVPGALGFAEAVRLVDRLAAHAPGVKLLATDRTLEKPYWW